MALRHRVISCHLNRGIPNQIFDFRSFSWGESWIYDGEISDFTARRWMIHQVKATVQTQEGYSELSLTLTHELSAIASLCCLWNLFTVTLFLFRKFNTTIGKMSGKKKRWIFRSLKKQSFKENKECELSLYWLPDLLKPKKSFVH